MRPKLMNPRSLVHLMAKVAEGGACVECGYTFDYEPGFCPDCAPITAVLKAANLTHTDPRRS